MLTGEQVCPQDLFKGREGSCSDKAQEQGVRTVWITTPEQAAWPGEASNQEPCFSAQSWDRPSYRLQYLCVWCVEIIGARHTVRTKLHLGWRENQQLSFTGRWWSCIHVDISRRQLENPTGISGCHHGMQTM